MFITPISDLCAFINCQFFSSICMSKHSFINLICGLNKSCALPCVHNSRQNNNHLFNRYTYFHSYDPYFKFSSKIMINFVVNFVGAMLLNEYNLMRSFSDILGKLSMKVVNIDIDTLENIIYKLPIQYFSIIFPENLIIIY